MDDFTAKLWLYYISEIPVASDSQRIFNIIPDRDTEIQKPFIIYVRRF